MSHELELLVILAILIGVSKLFGHLSQALLRLPMVFGEILGGLIIGPTLLDLPARFGHAWPGEVIGALAGLGVAFLMFVAGLETDIGLLRRVGRTAVWTAVVGVLLPLTAGVATARLFGLEMKQAWFIGAVLTATSVSISAQTLLELGQLASREGAVILGAAVIDDVLGIIVLSFVIALGAAGADAGRLPARLEALAGLAQPSAPVHMLFVLLCMAGFFLLAWVARRAVAPVLAAAQRLHASFAVPAAAVVLLLLFSAASDALGQVAAITGAYIAGIYVGRTPFRAEVEHAVRPITYALLVPVFFMSLGLTTNLRTLHDGWPFAVTLVVVAVLTKVVGCGAGAHASGFTGREALRVGVGMVSRGEVGLIIALVGMQYGIVSPPVYAAVILMTLVSTLATPLLLRATFPHLPPVEAEVIESVAAVETEAGEPGDA